MNDRTEISRRRLLGATGAAVASLGLPAVARAESTAKPAAPFRHCLNTGTIRGQKVGLARAVEIAAAAGYTGIEPWIEEIAVYQQGGGSLPDMQKKIADLGLTVESAIGFARWISDDENERREGLEQAKRDMELVKAIGGQRIAAPPAGATDKPGLDLQQAAGRYRALLEAGDQIGVTPQLELWGFSQNLHRLGQVAFVAIESGHPLACVLPDVYHIYKGGSDFEGLRLFNGLEMHAFHVNDYPADPPRATINDSHRVFCGDGVAPLSQILQTLHAAGFRGALSLELFNQDYYKRDPLAVAREGLEKTKAAVAKAGFAPG
jgi:sugar phosphate isomerase/epimerase